MPVVQLFQSIYLIARIQEVNLLAKMTIKIRIAQKEWVETLLVMRGRLMEVVINLKGQQIKVIFVHQFEEDGKFPMIR